MQNVTSVELKRDCPAVQIPAGTATSLPAGTPVDVTQTLGGSYTVHAPGGLFRIAAQDADALGLDAPWLEQVFALVMGSQLAFFSSRARYAPVGKLRETSEKELILCNQLARRETVLRHGGFNEALYPNEENALMDDIQKHGGKLLYDPELLVYRRPRRTLQAFAKMLRTYGRGRAEQFRVNPTFGSAPNFGPPLFLLYLMVLAVLWVGAFVTGQQRIAAVCSLPLIFYALLVLVQTAALVPRGGMARSLCALPLIALAHVLYGLGFWRGLFTRLKAPTGNAAPPVTLEIVPR